MALNSSGPISLAGSTTGQSIAVELGVSATAQISLNCTNVRTLAGVSSGAITMPTNFYGKSSTVAGSQSYTTAGTYTWIAPTGVTSVSVVTVGAGGLIRSEGPRGYGGGGGALAYKNNISVTPGTGYSVVVAYPCSTTRSSSYFKSNATVGAYSAFECCAGCVQAGTGYRGGQALGYFNLDTTVYSGGGGAAGYAGCGGRGDSLVFVVCPCSGCYTISCPPTAGAGGGGGGGNTYGGGGGVGLYGQGANGAAGAGAFPGGKGGSGGGDGLRGGTFSCSYQSGGLYGGGASGCNGPRYAGNGAVRIVYPGTTRQFPSTCVGAP